jgi:outer membrane lipoprotein-sorting protein
MIKSISIFLIFAAILLLMASPGPSSGRSDETQILAVVQKMESAFKTVVNYSCEVEVVYYQNGIEDKYYQFKFYFKRDKKIRVDFSQPYPGLSIFYNEGDKEATVKPFRFLPAVKFRFSIDNPMIKTLAGQKIDQTDMGYFIDFLSRNLKMVKQKEEEEFHEDEEQIKFLFLAMDYIKEKSLEKYRIFVSKKNWLPIRIERYNLEGQLIEVSILQNYTINTHLEDKYFLP